MMHDTFTCEACWIHFDSDSALEKHIEEEHDKQKRDHALEHRISKYRSGAYGRGY